MNIFDGIHTVDELAAQLEKMSLVKQDLLGKPMTPMLVLAGVKDTQVPIADVYLLLSKGDTPKTAWINPAGGHLGRQVGYGPTRAFSTKSSSRGWLKLLSLKHRFTHLEDDRRRHS